LASFGDLETEEVGLVRDGGGVKVVGVDALEEGVEVWEEVEGIGGDGGGLLLAHGFEWGLKMGGLGRGCWRIV